jgi:hypothetical protein
MRAKDDVGEVAKACAFARKEARLKEEAPW